MVMKCKYLPLNGEEKVTAKLAFSNNGEARIFGSLIKESDFFADPKIKGFEVVVRLNPCKTLQEIDSELERLKQLVLSDYHHQQEANDE